MLNFSEMFKDLGALIKLFKTQAMIKTVIAIIALGTIVTSFFFYKTFNNPIEKAAVEVIKEVEGVDLEKI